MAISVLFLLAAASGCAAVVAGAGVGAFSYVSGELSRDYPATYARSITACEAVAKELKIRIVNKQDDGVQCNLDGKEPDGTGVIFRVKNLSPHHSSIGVRVGYVGLWDRDVAESIHSYLAENMGVKATQN